MTESVHTGSFEMAPFPKSSFYGWFYANVFNRATFWCTEIHRTLIYTGKLHSFEIKGTQDLSPAQEGCSCHKNQVRAGLCSHTSSCSWCTKTPRRRVSHWLPGTVEGCSSTEELLHHEASVHNQRFKHLNIHTLMRGTSRGLAHPPPASKNRWIFDINDPMI